MLLFDRGRQDVLVTAVTPGWDLGRFNIAIRYQGLLGGIFFCHGNHKAQTDPFAGLGGGWEKGGVFFCFSCTANIASESEQASGRGGRVGEEQASTYYIPTVSTVTLHNHNSWGKTLHCRSWRRQDSFVDAAGEGWLSQHLWLAVPVTWKQGPAKLMRL